MTEMNVVVTVGGFVLTHAGATIWFLSKVNTTLTFVMTKMTDIEKALLKTTAETMQKETALERFVKCEGQLAAIWKRLEDSSRAYMLREDFETYRKETRETLHDVKEMVVKLEAKING